MGIIDFQYVATSCMHAVFAVPFAVIGVVFRIRRSASKATGHSFYYLKGAAALLELAMVQYAVQKLTAKVWPSAKCQQTNVCVCVCVRVCVRACIYTCMSAFGVTCYLFL